MKKTFTFLALLTSFIISAQLNPAITNWLVNTTNITGRHYVSGNSTPITDAVLANVQTVQYNTNYVYVTATGIPAYITGPFLDGNPSLATAQNKIFRITLTPTQNTGTLTATTGGNIGIFKNGVALFDYRDGVSYKNSTGAEAGGPIGGTGDGVWNRDAIVAERGGFDCSKAHPAQGNYHHHQNPSAFNLDLQVLSTICDTYPSDGLYVINPSQHSPLLGYAYDGFPIYGAYAYANTDGTGGIVRMKSSYQLRNITARTYYADGTDVTDGPPVNTTYPLGRYREDYEFVTNSSPDYLDKHNGRFCITPEYPSGIYCYFTTVDANHNSAYPYAVGPYFYGVKNTTTGGTVTSIPGGTTTLSSDSFENNNFDITIAPNPASEFIAIQSKMTESDLDVELISELGQVIKKSKILQGSTLSIIETDSVYNGIYFVKISSKNNSKTYKVIIKK
ncbi:YHYH protein [Flavobacterium sp.]|uniref:YHYH protein n=1 Tax=Flavobacterium sp. TaxID=239 RepID=UPI0040488648